MLDIFLVRELTLELTFHDFLLLKILVIIPSPGFLGYRAADSSVAMMSSRFCVILCAYHTLTLCQ